MENENKLKRKINKKCFCVALPIAKFTDSQVYRKREETFMVEIQ
jgi:hypothetical protein